MNLNRPHIKLQDNSLSAERLNRLKWCTTIAIIGFPIMVQILGAMLLFSGDNPGLVSVPALMAYAAVFIMVIASGIYAVTNRVFLRFSGANDGLQEWEAKTQRDAFAFSYGIIAKGALLAFAGMSILGFLQFLNYMGWVDVLVGQSIALNVEGLAALCVILTYFILLLPTLYISWTLAPLNAEETS